MNGDSLSLPFSAELMDNLKADILREIRTEVQKAKQEILDGEWNNNNNNNNGRRTVQVI